MIDLFILSVIYFILWLGQAQWWHWYRLSPVLLLHHSEPYIIFSGGLSYDKAGRRPTLTIMHGKAITVLEMDYPIVEFMALCETPYNNGECVQRQWQNQCHIFWMFKYFQDVIKKQ